MVRKRSRTTRKVSEDEADSDTDLEIEDEESSEPQPRKYSLRQRKRPTFCEDFDYDEDGEVVPSVPSEDEEYHVENDLEEVREKREFKTFVRRPRGSSARRPRRKTEDTIESSVDIIETELPVHMDEMPNDSEAVDFEDMIRADVVMNRRVDYDHVINKTEIKMQTHGANSFKKIRPKRNQKVKNYNEDIENKDSNLESNDNEFVVVLDPTMMFQDDKEDNDEFETIMPELTNGLSNSSDDLPLTKFIDKVEETKVENNGTVEDSPVENNTEEEPVKEDVVLDENGEKIVFPDPSTITDEELLNNCHMQSEVSFVEYTKDTYDIFEDPKFTDDDDGDDVILIEPKQEVIVLDDD